METFSITLVLGWNQLTALLVADATYKGHAQAADLYIRDNDAAATMIVKFQPSAPAGGDASGIHLTIGTGVKPDHQFYGNINLDQVWIKSSAAGVADVAFARQRG